jgi:hypothetical protein
MSEEVDKPGVINLNDWATNLEALNRPEPTSDLEGLQDPSLWPFRPMCPVVRRASAKYPYIPEGGWPECGTVLEAEPGRVYHIGMHHLLCMNQGMQKDALGDAKTTEYGSWGDMLAARWEVD